MPIAQSSPLLTYQTAQRKPSKPLEQSYLEWWGQNYEGFGHNHKHYIRGELTRCIMKVHHAYCKTLTWITDVLGICELHRQLVKNDGKVNAVCFQKILEENLHSSGRKLHMGCTRTFQNDSDPEQKVRSTFLWLQQKEVKVLGVAILVSWPQHHWASLEISQTCSSCKTVYRIWRYLARKNGQLYHLRKLRCLIHNYYKKTSSCHWC